MRYQTVSKGLVAAVVTGSLLASSGASLLLSNASSPSDTNLIVDADGVPLSVGGGCVMVGSFDVSDAQIIAASGAGAAAYYDSHFTPVESGAMGLGTVPGVFELFVPSLSAGHGLIGEEVYTVIGNGTAVGTSSAFIVYKHDLLFESGDNPVGAGEGLMAATGSGLLLVGDLGIHQAAASPFALADAYSLTESGGLSIDSPAGALVVEPGAGVLVETLTSSPPGASFSLVDGPAWVSVDSNGTVTASPPFGSAGSYEVTVSASTAGGEVFETQIEIDASASFGAWQEANFNLPAEAALAAPLADPNGNGIVNLFEYATRGGDTSAIVSETGGQRIVSFDVRDDDPELLLWFETSADLIFGPPSPSVDDPFSSMPLGNVSAGIESSLGDGMKRLSLELDDPSDEIGARLFARPVIEGGD